MPPYFFDTSALVKRYHIEDGTDRIDQVFSEADGPLIISNITIAEFTSAFARKKRDGAIDEKTLRYCLSSFSTDLLMDFWIIDLERTQCPVFVCADKRLLDAAFGEGLDVLNPTD